ncbi:UDP-N-acetylenolpyruvoylglucosamine reductase [Candidatus Magnetoovum chiemensis]|nr:UDP-N-acetylenolpyruvoylglucosamine reductase [Candidatus Magnetoovum chiemensis]
MNIKTNFPLKDLTTFKIGGCAKYFVTVNNEQELNNAVDFAKERAIDIFALGGGSNILVADEGFDGLVIYNKIYKIEKTKIENDHINITVGAGVQWHEFVLNTAYDNLQGLECLCGIPGSVGASPVQNIGAYGQSAGDAVCQVRAFDTNTCIYRNFTNNECNFDYRSSIFNTELRGRYIISEVTFKLIKNAAPILHYRDIKEYFKDTSKPTLIDVCKAVLEIRSKKGMIILDGYEKYNSAGSFFKNPVVNRAEFETIASVADKSGRLDKWYWTSGEDKFKVSTACLIELAGFHRGFTDGAVGISPKHTLSIINHNDAQARDVIAFAKRIQDKVGELFGVSLTPEVQFVGFSSNIS